MRHDQTGNRSAAATTGSSRNRQIVVCCDGTNNTLTAGVKDTNVVQLHERLRAERDRQRADDPGGPEQVLYYDPGVGSAVGLPPTGVVGVATEALRRIGGLALGSGIDENIGEAYLHLCREYGRLTPDASTTTDEIWLFGFSRGAFTVRAVAGMVNLFGLVRPEHESLLPTLLRIYFADAGPPARSAEPSTADEVVGRRPAAPSTACDAAGDRAMGAKVARQVARVIEQGRASMDQHPAVMMRASPDVGGAAGPATLTRRTVAAQIRREFTTDIGRDAWVHFVGVWDTVDSVGILPGARKRISSAPTIHENRYRHVRHALALDEHRRQFLPRSFDGRIAEGQTLGQQWFRGAHSDIGGSRPAGDSLLSFETFKWMTDEAIACGLRLPPVERERAPESIVEVIGDQLRAQPAWVLTGMALRDPMRAPGTGHVGPLPADPQAAAHVLRPREHHSVKEFSADGPGARGPGAPRSPWEPGNGPRARALAILLGLTTTVGWVCLVIAGALATPGPAGLRLLDATDAGLRLVGDQVTLFWPSMGDGAHGLGLRLDPAEARFEDWATADRDGAQASYGWAQLFVIGFVLSAASVVARLPARAFARLTSWRSVRDPQPRPRWAMNALGLGFAVAVLAFAAQTLLLILAWVMGGGTFRPVLLALAAEAGVVAGIGVLLTAVLVGWWVVREFGATFTRRAD